MLEVVRMKITLIMIFFLQVCDTILPDNLEFAPVSQSREGEQTENDQEPELCEEKKKRTITFSDLRQNF